MAVDQKPQLTDENRSKRYELLSNEFIVGVGLFVGGLIGAAAGYFLKVDWPVFAGLIGSTLGSCMILHSLYADPRPKE